MGPKQNLVKGIVIIVDVSKAVRSSTEVTFYSQAKQCLLSILQRKIFSENSKDVIGIVLIGTDDTNNKLAVPHQYQHISVIQELQSVDWDMVKLAENIERGNSQGDWLDALVVALDLLHEDIGCVYSSQQIVLMTDFNMEFNDDKSDAIIQSLQQMDVDFNVIGPSLDDDDDNEFGPSTSNGRNKTSPINWNGKPKTKQQLAAESLLKRMLLQVGGKIYSFDEAIPQLLFYEKKSQGSSAWNCLLTFGNTLQIPITGRIKIRPARIPTWKRSYAKSDNAAIISETSYIKRDENQTKVDDDDVISGFKYGSTIVPFAKTDTGNNYKSNATGPELSILNFSPASSIPLNMRAGDQVMVVTAKEHDEEAAIALSAIIQAMNDLDMVAITRRIYRRNLNPVLGALIPEITDNHECLLWIGLPFREDMRNFIFPSFTQLEDVITDNQRQIMDQYIDSMMLETNEDEEEEGFDPANVLNPRIQHYYNCLTQRALYPELPVPAPLQSVVDILNPRQNQIEAATAIIDSLKDLFPTIKKIIKDKPVDIFNNVNIIDPNQPSTSRGHGVDLTIGELMNTKVTKITTVSPSEDFMAMLKSSQPDYNNICVQMEDIIFKLIDQLTSSAASDEVFVARILEALKTYRREAVEIEPTKFNKFIKNIKSAVITRSLMHLWLVITQNNLGLINCKETLKSNYSEQEAKEFYQLDVPVQSKQEQSQSSADYEDLLDDL